MSEHPTQGLTRRAAVRAGALALGLAALPAVGPTGPAAATHKPFRLLVFSRTTGFRHGSIPDGIRTITALGAEHGFSVDATEDPAVFAPASLAPYAAVAFVNTTGTVLDTGAQRSALEHFVRAGGGFVGVHAAADTEYEWGFYGRLVGARFKCHPVQQLAFFDTEDSDHPATAHLSARFVAFDEFYSFGTNPRPDVRVLLTIDERTYLPDPNTTNLPVDQGGTYNPTWLPGQTGYMSGVRLVPGDHPMSWTHQNLGGTSFYTALGHEPLVYQQEWFRQHLLGGILSAARATG